MTITFNDSDDYTVGIEVETQLIDKDTFALAQRSSDIVARLAEHKKAIKHELMLSNLEINTRVCANIKEAEEDLKKKFAIVLDEAAKYNTLISCAGTHPFSEWKDQILTGDDRYKRLMEKLQIIARRFNIFGLHIHVGVEGGDRCIYILKRLLYYLPHLLALSANSPFWEGNNTGLRSYRTKVFESLPIAGLPFYFKDWNDYTSLLENYLATGTVESVRDIWWDVRPHPDFGTIEVRICDTPSTLKEILGLAALIQALVKRFGEEYEDGVPFIRPHSAVIRENKWRACRYGLDGEFITTEGDKTVGVRKSIGKLIDSVRETSGRLDSTGYLEAVDRIIKDGEGAVHQLKDFDLHGDVRLLAQRLSQKLYNELSYGQ